MADEDDPYDLLDRAFDLRHSDPGDSLEHLERATAAAPDDPSILTEAAMLLVFHGRYEDAEELADVAAALARDPFPLQAKLSWLQGVFARERGHFDDVERHFRHATDAAPEFGEQLAYFLQSQGRLDEALAAVEEALLHAPDDRDLHALRDELTGGRRRAAGSPTVPATVYWLPGRAGEEAG